jgi:hypothetical protein
VLQPVWDPVRREISLSRGLLPLTPVWDLKNYADNGLMDISDRNHRRISLCLVERLRCLYSKSQDHLVWRQNPPNIGFLVDLLFEKNSYARYSVQIRTSVKSYKASSHRGLYCLYFSDVLVHTRCTLTHKPMHYRLQDTVPSERERELFKSFKHFWRR